MKRQTIIATKSSSTPYVVGILLGALLSLILVVTSASAENSCQPIYGGGQTCVRAGELLINKLVLHPQSNAFVDNLSITDARYLPEQTVPFKIVITNSGDERLGKIVVKDTFPNLVSFVLGPGTFDANTKTLTIEIDGLAPNETKEFTFNGKVVPSEQLPVDQGIACVINQATATLASDARQSASDNAQLCIEKRVLGEQVPAKEGMITKGGLKVFPAPTVAITPPTGPELLSLLLLLPTGIIGQILRKKSNKHGYMA